MKTKSSAAKRFKVTGTGKLMRNKAGKSHLLSCKKRKRKRNLRRATEIMTRNAKTIKQILQNF
jgi:large subunit ribosomal protein L35